MTTRQTAAADISQARGLRISGAVFVMIFAGLFLTVHLEKIAAAPHAKTKIADHSKELTPHGKTCEPAKAKIGDETVSYYQLKEKDGKVAGYILSNQDLGKSKDGYNGPIILQVRVSAAGVAEDFLIQQHHETPRFLKRVLDQKAIYLGKNIFLPAPARQPDIVTGATYSSSAISDDLRQIGAAFGPVLLPQKQGASGSPAAGIPAGGQTGGGWASLPLTALALVFFLTLALVLRFWNNAPRHRLIRPVFLLLVFLVFGAGLAMQFSLESVLALFTGDWPGIGASPAFLLAVVIPVSVLLIGNHYCGWLCPFGALQELVHAIAPHRYRHFATHGYARYLRYGLLLGALAMFTALFSANASAAGGGDAAAGMNCCDVLKQKLSGADLLGGLFPLVWGSGLAVFALCLFPLCRFWCRCLCPSGAFLSLLGRANLLRRAVGMKRWLRWLPVRPRHCDLGVLHPQDGECFQCDRCRDPQATDSPAAVGRPAPRWLDRSETVLAVATAAAMFGVYLHVLLQ